MSFEDLFNESLKENDPVKKDIILRKILSNTMTFKYAVYVFNHAVDSELRQDAYDKMIALSGIKNE